MNPVRILSKFGDLVLPAGMHPADKLGWLMPQNRRDALDARIGELIASLRSGVSLDQALTGFDGHRYLERVVEYPYTVDWLSRYPDVEALLDIGSVMNSRNTYPTLKAIGKPVWFCNPAVEQLAWNDLETYYCASPLDEAFTSYPLQFSHVTCLSTIEHIGYDNSQYGALTENPLVRPDDATWLKAVQAVYDRIAPGGHGLISVPFGARDVAIHRETRKAAFQVFDAETVQAAVDLLLGQQANALFHVFAGGSEGWHRVEDPTQAEGKYAHGFAGASAVAFVEMHRAAE